jgi:hypothetical protein
VSGFVNAAAATVALACLVWLLWPALRDRPPTPAHAVVAGLGTGLVGAAALAAFDRWDLALASILACAALDLAGLAAGGLRDPAAARSRPEPGGRARCRPPWRGRDGNAGRGRLG